MLDLGNLNRRSLLQRSGMGLGALGLTGLLADDPARVVQAAPPEAGLGVRGCRSSEQRESGIPIVRDRKFAVLRLDSPALAGEF